MDVNGAVLADLALIAPNSLDQLRSAKRSIWVAGEMAQEPKFSGGQVDLVASTVDLQSLWIEHHVAEG